MVHPIASQAPQQPSSSLPVPPPNQPLEESEGNPIEHSAQSGGAWELFSGEAQLESQLQEKGAEEQKEALDVHVGSVDEAIDVHVGSMDEAILWEKEAIMETVKLIFKHPFIRCTETPRTQEILSQITHILSSLSIEDRGACIDQLRSITCRHENCNRWAPDEILKLLEKLVAIPPPPIRRKMCVVYLNTHLQQSSIQVRANDLFGALEKISAIEQRLYDFSPDPKTPQLFVRLFYPYVSLQPMEAICIEIEKFPRKEVNKIMKQALILRGCSEWINDTQLVLRMLHSIPAEDRDACVPLLQTTPGQIFYRINLLNCLISLRDVNREECIRLMNSVMALPHVIHWTSDQAVALLVAIANIRSEREVCIHRFENIIHISGIHWSAERIVEFLQRLLPVKDRIECLNLLGVLMQQPCHGPRWKAWEIMVLFSQIGSIRPPRKECVDRLATFIQESDEWWSTEDVIDGLKTVALVVKVFFK